MGIIKFVTAAAACLKESRNQMRHMKSDHVLQHLAEHFSGVCVCHFSRVCLKQCRRFDRIYCVRSSEK